MNINELLMFLRNYFSIVWCFDLVYNIELSGA